MVVYYLIKHVTTKPSAKHIDPLIKLLHKCFSCLNMYKTVGKGWVKCARKPYRVFCLFLNLITDF